ncbi:MAG: acyl carrier protein [Coprococcus sp.]|nr:acyl carrier protein [Coprococcus sp.]
MEELLEIMHEVKPGVTFEGDSDLIGHGLLDSIAIVTLVGELCDAFDIEISPVDVVPENFKTVEAIYALITRLQED